MMAAARRIAVIGGGIVGLSAALALQDAGASVRVFEKGEPGQAQSVGLARIFRLSHGNPTLVHLAMRAYDGWRSWERRFGRHLLGQEGMIVTGEATVEEYSRALHAAGAPSRMLDAAEARALLPIGRFPQDRILLDSQAGSTRVRRTIECLCAALTTPVTRGEVREIRITSSGHRSPPSQHPGIVKAC
jgi:sarcosine oxidase